VLVITVLQFALPILVWVASVKVSLTFELDEAWRPKQYGYGLATSGKSALYQLLNVLVVPLTSIMTALLYLKTRQAGGESMADAVLRFDTLDVPRSRWHARMKSRLGSPGRPTTGGRSG
jgi:hypothetical protein